MPARRGARLGLVIAGCLLLRVGSAAGQKVLPGALEQSKADAEAAKCAFATAKGLTEILGPLSGCKSPPPPAPGSSPPPPSSSTPRPSPAPVVPPVSQPPSAPAPVVPPVPQPPQTPAPAPAPSPVTRFVLATGGADTNLPQGFRILGTTELFDVAAGAWSFTGNMTSPRLGFSFARLSDGTVLVAGGTTTNFDVDATAESYSFASGVWVATPTDMNTPRFQSEMVALDDGRALVAGGQADFSGRGVASSEVFSPATGQWLASGSMATPRTQFSMVKLASGLVLAAGGTSLNSQPAATTNTVDIYDPATGVWTATGAMQVRRREFQLVTLFDGKVLAAGGRDETDQPVALAETWDPATGLWTTVGQMLTPRAAFQAELLPSGLVIAAGGEGDAAGSTDVFNPSTNAWAPAAGTLGGARRLFQTSVILPSGQVLAAGGVTQNAVSAASALIFDPVTTLWSATGSLGEARYSLGMVALV